MKKKIDIIPHHAAGYTLVEVLVAIGVVLILFAIIIAGVSRVQTRADQASGQAALRSIGGALALYINDNNMRLPQNGSWTEFVVRERHAEYYDLMPKLAPYLGAADLPANAYVPGTASRAFIREAYAKDPLGPWQTAAYMTTPFTRLVDGTHTRFAFGYRQLAPGNVPESALHHNIADPSNQFAIIEFDSEMRMIDGGVVGPQWYLLPKPIHGDVRFALFFDWHVRAIPLDENFYSDKRW